MSIRARRLISDLFFLFDSDNLMKYLRPFAEEGKVVGDEDVKAFFEHLKGQEAPGR